MAKPLVGIIGPVAICPFCDTETLYSVVRGQHRLGPHHLPDSHRPCPDSCIDFRPFDLRGPESDEPELHQAPRRDSTVIG